MTGLEKDVHVDGEARADLVSDTSTFFGKSHMSLKLYHVTCGGGECIVVDKSSFLQGVIHFTLVTALQQSNFSSLTLT